MSIFHIDPLRDSRWNRFVENQPTASVFHGKGWLEALRRTYGYDPIVFTTSSPSGPLQNGLLFCRVRSWLTGKRMVSVPFSDHCEPLVDSLEEFDFLIKYLCAELQHQDWKYVELRGFAKSYEKTYRDAAFRLSQKYYLHVMDISRNLDQIFNGLAKDSVQRRIRRAENAHIRYERGATAKHLREFYRLLVLTRARHYLPPQPYKWFKNLVECMGDALQLRLAYHDQKAVAAVISLRFRDTTYYKYGCSDSHFKNLGAMPFLLWKTIEESKEAGAVAFDFGRSERNNKGLIAFKEHWTTTRNTLSYWRFPTADKLALREARNLRIAKRVFSFIPNGLLVEAGKLLYRHIG